MPFAVATLAINFPITKPVTPSKLETTSPEEIYNDVAFYFVTPENRKEVIKNLAPLIDLVTDPSQAAEILKNELHIDISDLDINSLLEETKEFKKNSENK